MARPSDEQQRALAGLLGLGNHSARKSHYPELAARLEDLETERNRYKLAPAGLAVLRPQRTRGGAHP